MDEKWIMTASWISSALVVSLAMAVGAARIGAQAAPVRTVDQVDLDRYLGKWFEIARFEAWFQKKCTGGHVTATYAHRPDGRIAVLNECRTKDGPSRAEGVARVVDTASNAKLKVRFAPAFLSWLPSVWGDYWVIGLAPDYSWAVVGDPSRQYLWVLSRTPALDGETYARALATATAQGFDVSKLVLTAQE